MGLLKAVCLDSMLARLASARLPERRCDVVPGALCRPRALWWLPVLPRWGSEPPLGTVSSSSESPSWYLASRCAVGRGIWVTCHGTDFSEHAPSSLYDGKATFHEGPTEGWGMLSLQST